MCEANEGKGTADGSKIHDTNGGEEDSSAMKLEGGVSLGDLIWVKLRGNIWWPGLVVDENGVCESFKPGNKSEGKVLVRLYGTYDYSYADVKKYNSEFKMVLQQNDGNCLEIFDKALELHRSRRKSSKPKDQGSKPTEQERPRKKQKKNNQTVDEKEGIKQNAVPKKPPKSPTSKEEKGGKSSKRVEEQRKVKPDTPSSNGTMTKTLERNKLLKEKTNIQTREKSSPGKSPESSARRMRVMQGLGLSAPPGSPFQKNRLS